MARVYLCFLWHMHQPFYKDLLSGEYRLPWTRMHALKDYYGMVRILKEFPAIRQTFNVVPSMLVQVEEYALGLAADPFLRCAAKPAEELTADECEFILRYFFQANPSHLIYRYARYGELYDDWLAAGQSAKRVRNLFSPQAFRDLQVLSQLAWFDEEFQAGDPDVRDLIAKQRSYSLDDQSLMVSKQKEILGKVLPVYQSFAASGQIEISTTPFYHPILPLLCDSGIADVSHPHVPLPNRFRYPEDARWQLERARGFVQERLGRAPAGLWPSEGSVSDEALGIAAESGFRWAATDDGILARTLGSGLGPGERYRPYAWSRDGREIRLVFRDHYLSDLIGFVYSRMGAAQAAADFLNRIRENCLPVTASGQDALVPIILDGENAWEYYEESGRPFLRELYRRISDDPLFTALTISEALERVDTAAIDRIFPGSWINSNFDVWIGAEEDNRAWEFLLRARQSFDQHAGRRAGAEIPEENRKLAYEELLIAEGSDWCWWYGPEHISANRPDFDRLYRGHLANVYRALNLSPPDELSRPILRAPVEEFHARPSGPVRPEIDGEVTSFFEWLGAGVYRVDARTGAMHGQRRFLRELHYGSDGDNLFLRLDFESARAEALAGVEVRVTAAPLSQPSRVSVLRMRCEPGTVTPIEIRMAVDPESGARHPEYVFRRILEIGLPLGLLAAPKGQTLRFQVSLWQDSLPMDALPQEGWIECETAAPADWPL